MTTIGMDAMLAQRLCATPVDGGVPGLSFRVERADPTTTEEPSIMVVASAKKMYRRGSEFRQSGKFAIAYTVSIRSAAAMMKLIEENLPLMHKSFTCLGSRHNRKVWIRTDAGIVELTKDGNVGQVFRVPQEPV